MKGKKRGQASVGALGGLSYRLPAVTIGLATFLALVALAPGATAANTPRVSTMSVSVVPEYDQPRVLVSVQGRLEGATMPQQLSVRLPADAEIGHACGLEPPDDSHACQPFTTETEGDSLVLNYETPFPNFYVEYRYGSVQGAGNRAFDFAFWPPFPVDSLELWVQEPADATDFALSPSTTETVVGNGSRQYGYTFEDLSPDQPVSLQLSYARATDEPSVQPGEPPKATKELGGWDHKKIGMALGVVGGLILAAIVFASVSGRRRLASAEATATPRVRGRDESPATPSPATVFCGHCGARLSRETRFCSQCGRALRLPFEGSP